MATKFKIPVHIEIAIRHDCSLLKDEIVNSVSLWVRAKYAIFQNCSLHLDQEISRYISSIDVVDLAPGRCVSFWQAELCFHPYRLCEQGPESDFMDGEEELPAAEQWELPNVLLNNLWNSIVIENSIKSRLLSYCSSSIQFSDARIDTDIISWNRMVLLHGPPGTGKTTICKGLAQKTFIRNSDRFTSGMLLEVNSHSLFSKWFSESGKLVMKLFSHIGEIADDEECMVVVLIDEVESITSARSNSATSNEPGDAVRVVNAVLTSLDALKRRPNVLVLCTSNLIDSVDTAFLDRVDLKVYLGPPILSARYKILHSCLMELMRKGIVDPKQQQLEPMNDDCSAVENQLIVMLSHRSVTYNANTNSNQRNETINNSYYKTQCNSSECMDVSSIPSNSNPTTSSGGNFSSPTSSSLLSSPDLLLAAFIRSITLPVIQDDESKHHTLKNNGQPSGYNSNNSGGGGGVKTSGISSNNSTCSSTEIAVTAVESLLSATSITTTAVITTSTTADSVPTITTTIGGNHLLQEGTAYDHGLTAEQYLYVLAAICENMSGRSLRKLPIKAHAYFLQRSAVTLMDFISAMHATVKTEKD